MFISFEGISGSGVSTQARALYKYLESTGRRAIITHDPGGSLLAEQIQLLLLQNRSNPCSSATEALLRTAARADHLEQVIQPALAKDKIVVCEHYIDSELVSSQRPALVERLSRLVTPRQPDLTFLIDTAPEEARARWLRQAALSRPFATKQPQPLMDLQRAAYLQRAEQFSDRFRIIDGNQTIKEVQRKIIVQLQTENLLPILQD